MHTYRHIQFGTLTIGFLLMGLALAGAIAVSTGGHPVALTVFVILLLLIPLVYNLTVEIRQRKIVVFFGIGLIRRTFDLDDVCSARPVRNHWFYGWGVRLTPHGWMFNVSGLDAVELILASGRKFRIGTDEPQRLAEAIRQAKG
jgi:hypothetical protein